MLGRLTSPRAMAACTPGSCDDNDACTTDTCDPVQGCVFTPVNCDDGSVCTVDTCSNGGGPGVATLLIVLGIMTGMERDFRDKILGFNPHITVTSFSGPLDDWGDENALAPEIFVAAFGGFGIGGIV